MLVLLSTLLLAALPAAAFEESVDCPDGMERVQTENPYEPFKCQKPGAKQAGLKAVSGPRGFKTRPRCPRGTRPIMTSDKLQPYRCVSDASQAAEPSLEPKAEGCAEGMECVPAAPAATPALTAKSFRRYTIPGEISFDYPEDWKLTDAWKDEVPTLFIVFDPARGGRQVTMVVTRLEQEQAGYQEMEQHILKEKEWQGARETSPGRVAGLPARFTQVQGQSRSAYLAQGAGRYYTLVFTAPDDLYAAYEPAFSRLLKTFRLLGVPERP
jgi:hypothetical protein